MLLTLKHESWGANRIRYPGSPNPKLCTLGVGGFDPLCAGANAISVPPGSTAARLKLKEIDGGPHKRRSMWLNSMQREEPYQGLTCSCKPPERGEAFEGAAQVLHGCRQFVP